MTEFNTWWPAIQCILHISVPTPPVVTLANALCSTLTPHVYCLLRHVSACVHMLGSLKTVNLENNRFVSIALSHFGKNRNGNEPHRWFRRRFEKRWRPKNCLWIGCFQNNRRKHCCSTTDRFSEMDRNIRKQIILGADCLDRKIATQGWTALADFHLYLVSNHETNSHHSCKWIFRKVLQ